MKNETKEGCVMSEFDVRDRGAACVDGAQGSSAGGADEKAICITLSGFRLAVRQAVAIEQSILYEGSCPPEDMAHLEIGMWSAAESVARILFGIPQSMGFDLSGGTVARIVEEIESGKWRLPCEGEEEDDVSKSEKCEEIADDCE